MGRPADIPGKPREHVVTFRVTQEGFDVLERLRGDRSKSDYLRDLIKKDVERRKK